MIIIQILKIIGLVLLGIIGLVLSIILLVLLWPVRYRVQLNNKDSFLGKVTISWFMHFVNVNAYYKDDLNIILRVLGILFYNYQKRKEKQNKNSENKNNEIKNNEIKNNEKQNIKQNIKNHNIDNSIGDNSIAKKQDELIFEDIESYRDDNEYIGDANNLDNNAEIKEFLNENIEMDIEADSQKENSDDNKKNNQKESSKSGRNIWEKLKYTFQRIIQYICEIPEKLNDLTHNISKKVSRWIDTYEYYEKLLNKPGTKKVYEFLKKEILIILKHIKPRNGSVFFECKTDNPQKYAKVMQIYALTYLFLPKKTTVNSIYCEENSTKFDIIIKGRLILGFLAFHALKVMLNKKVKKLIHLLKRED